MGIKGAMLGDIAGSRFESFPLFRYEYVPKMLGNDNLNGMHEYDVFTDTCRFTDDTVMSIATAKAFKTDKDYAKAYREMYERYPDVGYGKAFKAWAENPEAKAYGSYGNGSAMRASFIGEAMKDNPFKFMVEMEAKRTAKVSHNHPEGIKGAAVIAVCVWMAERGKSKEDIQKYLSKQYPDNVKYKNMTSMNDLPKRADIKFSTKCQDTVPLAIQCFLQTENFFDCMSLINSMECDTDTIGAIASAICESFYGKCTEMDEKILKAYLTPDLQQDLINCGVDLVDRSDKTFAKLHDMIEEKYMLEAKLSIEYDVSDDGQYSFASYECENQISLDEYFAMAAESPEVDEQTEELLKDMEIDPLEEDGVAEIFEGNCEMYLDTLDDDTLANMFDDEFDIGEENGEPSITHHLD